MNRLTFLFLVCGYAVWGQDCSSVPSAITHYKIEKFVKKKKQLDDPKFLNDMKSELIRQISTAVSVSEENSTYVTDTKESNKYTSNVDITSSGLIINPQIDICVDKITMSVEKKFVHDLSRNYLTKVIGADTKSMLALIQHSTTTNKTFLKYQYKTFLTKEKYYAGLIPLALESKKEFSLEDYEDFKSTLYMLGAKANSSVVTRAVSYVRDTPKNTTQKSYSSSNIKPKKVAKQSAGYYKTKTSYSSYKKAGTVQIKGGGNIMGDFLSKNERIARVYNIEFMLGDVTYKDGSLPIGIGYKYIDNSKGMTQYNEIEYDDNLMQKDFGILYAKAGLAVGGFELYMTYGKSLTKLNGEYNFKPETSTSKTFSFREPNLFMYGFGIAIPLHKNFSLYGEYSTVDIDYLNPGGTEAQKSSSNISFGINININ